MQEWGLDHSRKCKLILVRATAFFDVTPERIVLKVVTTRRSVRLFPLFIPVGVRSPG